MLLACAVFTGLAFYFLPTRAHERYLFPIFALALPFAAARSRVFAPYAALAIAFAVSVYFAFTRYEQYVDLRVPQIIEATFFGRAGQIAIAVVMIATSAYLVWRLARGDARLETDSGWELPQITPGEVTWRLPAGLGPGRIPTRRDIAVATLIALAVLVTRGYRLDCPHDVADRRARHGTAEQHSAPDGDLAVRRREVAGARRRQRGRWRSEGACDLSDA